MSRVFLVCSEPEPIRRLRLQVCLVLQKEAFVDTYRFTGPLKVLYNRVQCQRSSAILCLRMDG